MITQSRLKQLLNYDQETGLFHWTDYKRTQMRASGEAGYIERSGCILIRIEGRNYFAHRLVWLYVYGDRPKQKIKHLDDDKTNNRINNLELVIKKKCVKKPKKANPPSIKIPQDMTVGTIHQTSTCGEISILEYIDYKNVNVKFINTGYVSTFNANSIRRVSRLRDPMQPTVFGIGFIGEGGHKAHTKGADTPIYRIWRAMLRRCYYRRLDGPKRMSYSECTVDKSWHNFQSFATWYIDNHPNDGNSYQLDKDIIKEGNKIYHPLFCKFVTQRENMLHINR